MRDNRDPSELGRIILSEHKASDAGIAIVADAVEEAIREGRLVCPAYNANPSTLEKYGDPRLLPSTLPN